PSSTRSAPEHNQPATTRSRAARSAFAAGAANAAASAVTLFPPAYLGAGLRRLFYRCPMGSIERGTRGATRASAHAHMAIGSGMSRGLRAGRSRGRPRVLKQKSRRGRNRGGLRENYIAKRFSVLGRPGSDLLFQVLRLSTIGAGKFNGRVRDGIGYRLPANTTRPAKDACQESVISGPLIPGKLGSTHPDGIVRQLTGDDRNPDAH